MTYSHKTQPCQHQLAQPNNCHSNITGGATLTVQQRRELDKADLVLLDIKAMLATRTVNRTI